MTRHFSLQISVDIEKARLLTECGLLRDDFQNDGPEAVISRNAVILVCELVEKAPLASTHVLGNSVAQNHC